MVSIIPDVPYKEHVSLIANILYHNRITQKMVADRANVSGTMVSLVLNGKAKSKKVLDAAVSLIIEKKEREPLLH